MELNDDNILRFWQWFVKHESTIQNCIENDDSSQRDFVVEQMNDHILGLGTLTWDLGLNDDDRWFLTLSPNGNEDMLKVSQRIMDSAPEHLGWQFHSSKPAKMWNREFTIYDSYMDEQLIDASGWHYLVFDGDDGKLELIIEANNISQLDAESMETAAEQFVIQEIGEVLRVLSISTIEIMHTLESEYQSAKASISELKDHLEEIS